MKQHVLILLITIGCLLTACSNANEKKAVIKPQLTEIKKDSLFLKPEDDLFAEITFSNTLSDYKEDPKKPKGQSFLVDDVKIADSLYKTFNAKQVIQQLLEKSIIHFPEEHKFEKLVYTANCDNQLLSTIHDCYDQHRPLVLTPDIIWVAICQGVSIHINKNFTSLEKQIFKEKRPKKLSIRNDSLVSQNGAYWADFIDSLSAQSIQYTKEDIYNFFVSEFSTSSKITKTVYQVTLLESQSKAFSYFARSGCGIPFMRISGTAADWINIKNKLQFLSKLGLSDWARNLAPILDEFILAAQGKANVRFWQSIYKDYSNYGRFYISGWILKFFPYIYVKEEEYDHKTSKSTVKATYVPNPFMEGNRYLRSTLSLQDIPSGMSIIDVSWENFFKMPSETKQLKVAAGFFGCKQYQDKSLEPFISWVIFEKSAPYFNVSIIEASYSQRTNSRSALKLPWYPSIAKHYKDLAIYDKKQFQTQENSIDFLRNLVLDSLSKHPLFKNKSFNNDTLEIEVLLDGTIGLVETVKQRTDETLNAFLRNLICGLPGPWSPATAKEFEVDFGHPSNRILRANSLVWIKL